MAPKPSQQSFDSPDNRRNTSNFRDRSASNSGFIQSENRQNKTGYNRPHPTSAQKPVMVNDSVRNTQPDSSVRGQSWRDISRIGLIPDPNGEGFVIAQNRKQRLPEKRVLGTAATTTLRRAPEVHQIVATKLAPDESAENVVQFLRSLEPLKDVDISAEKLNARYPDSYSTVKVTFRGATLETVYDPSLWPSGVSVRKFNPPPRQRNDRQVANRLQTVNNGS